ncbi:MAG TPA: 4Fe-4S dicluster domain-containing protein [Steroidobacteraceae bacterium]|nr:4Fe-4S dicluster domain-containing protein [Steroidobacteraceae bacterium]
MSTASDQIPTKSRQMAFVIDLRRCIGCDTCVLGCKVENDVSSGKSRLKVLDSGGDAIDERPRGTYPNISQYWVPTMCHHCADAPCVRVCPTTALWRRDEDGLVMLDKDKCVGCRRCEEACPYDALSFDDDVGTADKCNFCEHRIAQGQGPACGLVCPTRAILFGDILDPDATVNRLLATREHKILRASSGAKPQIYYLEP